MAIHHKFSLPFLADFISILFFSGGFSIEDQQTHYRGLRRNLYATVLR